MFVLAVTTDGLGTLYVRSRSTLVYNVDQAVSWKTSEAAQRYADRTGLKDRVNYRIEEVTNAA